MSYSFAFWGGADDLDPGQVYAHLNGEQLVEFVGYGWEPEHANAIIDAMHGLGLRLYDPQVEERFA